jgi:hypothetical protein
MMTPTEMAWLCRERASGFALSWARGRLNLTKRFDWACSAKIWKLNVLGSVAPTNPAT